MLVIIKQTKANLNNRFEISCNNQILYYANTPWMDISSPFHPENIRHLTFTDAQGNEQYHTQYDVLDNLREEAVPFKSFAPSGQRFCRFELVGQYGPEGSFYTLENGFFDSRLCIEWNGRKWDGYDVEQGRLNVVPIFDGDQQIAQITKPLVTTDNLDLYYLHLRDEYNYLLPILSFFTIYLDYRKYNHSGQLSKNSVKVSVKYSYNKNNNRYDPEWISHTFGPQAAAELNRAIGKQSADASAQIKKTLKIIGICFLVTVPVIIGLVFLLVHLLLTSRIPISAETFAAQMEAQGFQIYDISDRYDAALADSASIAVGPDYQIAFFLLSDNRQAATAFAQNKAVFESQKGIASFRKTTSIGTYYSYYLISDGKFFLVSCIDNTMIYCVTDKDYSDEIRDLIKELGYL